MNPDAPSLKNRFVLSLSKDRPSLLRAATTLALAFTLTACLPRPHIAMPPQSAAPFPVVAFFTGASHGEGRLHILFSGERAVHVTSHGTTLPPAADTAGAGPGAQASTPTLIIDQRIVEGDKAPRTRQWRIRETRPGHFEGSLSDATSPITADATPGRLHIRFTMKGGMLADQWLTLSADGQSAANVMTVRKFGITVAVLEERIVRD